MHFNVCVLLSGAMNSHASPALDVNHPLSSVPTLYTLPAPWPLGGHLGYRRDCPSFAGLGCRSPLFDSLRPQARGLCHSALLEVVCFIISYYWESLPVPSL